MRGMLAYTAEYAHADMLRQAPAMPQPRDIDAIAMPYRFRKLRATL